MDIATLRQQPAEATSTVVLKRKSLSGSTVPYVSTTQTMLIRAGGGVPYEFPFIRASVRPSVV
jgi:hypothetical protein